MSFKRFSVSVMALLAKKKRVGSPSRTPLLSSVPSVDALPAPTFLGPDADDASIHSSIGDAYLHPDVLDVRQSVRYSLNRVNGHIQDFSLLHTLVDSKSASAQPSPIRPLAAPAPDQSVCASANASTETLLNPNRIVQISDLQILRELGQGTFGQVYSVNDKVSSRALALKVMKKTGRSAYDLGLVIAEQKILKKTKGCAWFLSLEASFHDTTNFYFLMPLYPSDLESEIWRRGRFDFHHARFYTCELLVGLTALHELGIVHRDIKPANLLIDREGHLVIADFGLAKDFELEPSVPERMAQPYWPYAINDVFSKGSPPKDPKLLHFVTRTQCGSPLEMAPEVHRGDYYSFGADLWSAAVTLFWMVTGSPPWNANDNAELTRMINEDPLVFPPRFRVDEVTQDFLIWMLEKDPRDRLSALPTMRDHMYFDGIDWNLVKERTIPPPWIPSPHFQHACLESVAPLVPGLLYTPSTDPHPLFLYTSDKLTAPAVKEDDVPASGVVTEEPKPIIPPTRAQFLMKHILNKLRKSTLLFNSHRPAQRSLVEVVQPPNPNCPTPTNAQRIIQHVFNKLRKSTLLFKSHRQPPSSLFVMVQLPNPSPPHTDALSGAHSDGQKLSSLTRAQLIVRHVMSELGKQRSVVIPSISPKPSSVASVPRPAIPASGTVLFADTPPSPSLRPIAAQPFPPSVPAPVPGAGLVACVKGWFMRARHSPNYIPHHRRRANFLHDE